MLLISQIIVVAIGVALVILSAWGMAAPDKLISMVAATMEQRWGIHIAIIIRLLLGATLLVVAPGSPFPMVYSVLGWLAIVAAAGLAVVGRERTRRLLYWWQQRVSPGMTRLWLVFGLAFGVLLVYGGLPPGLLAANS